MYYGSETVVHTASDITHAWQASRQIGDTASYAYIIPAILKV